MGRVIGIDLGTTNCCVAVLDGFSPTVISNRIGYKTTPSMVAITEDGERLVGQLAARQAITNPEHTVYGTKRLLGRLWDSPQIGHALEHSSFELVEGPHGDVRIILRGTTYSIPEVSAMLLQEMRVVAEEHLNEQVDTAVVTVPAYFTDSQRQAVIDAGRIAGLDVLRIINEPTAAALAYGFNKGEDQTIAVYDLGGGTFDISILKLTPDGTFRVVATMGDSYLGGEDFDERIMDWLIGEFEKQNGADLRKSPVALQRLKQAAEEAKRELSGLTSTEVSLPFIATDDNDQPLNLRYELSREALEELTSDLITRTLHICEAAMQQARLSTGAIDEVILVGGMTRMPAVQFAVAEFFNREPHKGVHPDEVVALGAAIQGSALQEEVKNVNLEDVTAHSLGIMTAGGGFDVVIPTNAHVPVLLTEEFITSRDNQDVVKIVVLQGENDQAADNELLGQFTLGGLRPAPAGDVEIEVSFKIDADGIFSVSAKDKETGDVHSIEVTANSGLTDDEVDEMMSDSAAFLAERRAQERAKRVRQSAETVLGEIERLVPELQRSALFETPAGGIMIDRAREALARGRNGLAADDLDTLAADMATFEGVRVQLEKATRDE